MHKPAATPTLVEVVSSDDKINWIEVDPATKREPSETDYEIVFCDESMLDDADEAHEKEATPAEDSYLNA